MIPSITWKRWPSLFTDWQATSLQPPCPKAEQLLSICPNTRARPWSRCFLSHAPFSFLFFFFPVCFVLSVSVNDRERRVESQQTNRRAYGNSICCNQLFTFARCWLFRKRSFPLPPPPTHFLPYPSLSPIRTHMHIHTFHYAKELLQGKFLQTLMASDCSLATPAF